MALDGVMGGGIDPAAIAAAAAQAEAIRQAQEAAARQAAEEAARAAAAAEAARQAAAAAAAQEAAQKATMDRMQAKNFDHMDDKPNFDKMNGGAPAADAAPKPPDQPVKPPQSADDAAAERLANASARADDPRSAQHLAELAKDVKPLTNDDAQKQIQSIQEGVKNAKSPDELAALQTQSNVVVGRLAASPNPDPKLADQATQVHTQLAAANTAVQTLEQAHADVATGDVHTQANNAAKLLAGQPDVKGAVDTLKALPGFSDSTLGSKVNAHLQDTLKAADPAALASKLTADPNLANYPKDFATNIAKLQNAGNPVLKTAIDGVAANYLNSNPSANDVKADPGKAVLLNSLASSSDPAVQAKLQDTVHGWVEQSLKDHVGNTNHDSFGDGMKAFKSDLADLASKTGMGPLLGEQAGKVMGQDNTKNMLDDRAHKDEGFLDSVGDVLGSIGHFVGDIAGDIAHVAGSALTAVGNVAGEGLHLAGEGLGGIVKLESHALGGALDLVGAHGAANFVDHAGDAVASNVQAFGDGMGDGVKGMAKGVSFMVENPGQTGKAFAAMIKDPSLLVKAGKAMYDEAMKGGPAHAAGYIAANLLPVLLSGGSAGAVEGAGAVAEVAGETGARLAGEAAAEGAGSALSVGQRIGSELNQTFNSVQKAAGDLGKLKTSIMGDGKELGSLAGDLKSLPQDVAKNFRDLSDAIKSGNFKDAGALLKDNSVVDLGGRGATIGKQAFKVGKDTVTVANDARKILTDPLSFVTGKIEGRAISEIKDLIQRTTIGRQVSNDTAHRKDGALV